MEVKPGLIPDGWEAKTLGDICGRITTGKIDANAMVADGDYPFFTCASENYWIDKYAFDCEALLVSGNGANVGYVHYYNGKFNAYQRTYVISEFSADVQFIKLFLDRNLQERIRTEVNAGNTPYIRMDTLAEMRVIMPRSRAEQETIAGVLSDVDALIGALDRLIAKNRNLKQAAMQQLLTGQIRLPGFKVKPVYKQTEGGVIPEEWRVYTLGEICAFENGDRGSNYPSPGSFVLSGIPFVNAGHVAEGKINSGGMNYITTESYSRIGSGKVRAGDILFCLRGSLGKYGIVSDDFGDGAIASSLVIVRPKTVAVTREYLGFYFSSALCVQMIDRWSGGAAQPNLGAQDLARFSIPLPADQSEQTAITAVLSDMDAEIAALEARRDKTRALKQGMMQELLTGRTRLV